MYKVHKTSSCAEPCSTLNFRDYIVVSIDHLETKFSKPLFVLYLKEINLVIIFR